MRLFCISLFLIILISSFAFAAIIKGTVYGPDLDISENVIVKIDTKPAQQIIGKNGSYSFNVPIGNYLIEANTIGKESEQYYFSENINVRNDGEYIIDILMSPDFGEEIVPLPENDLKIELPEIEKTKNKFFLIIFSVIFLIFITIVILLFLKYKKNKSKENIPDDEYYNKIYDLIIKNKRMTQKEIVKEIPLSEAKISLILTDMESKGIIRKIKKGRANIIILNR